MANASVNNQVWCNLVTQVTGCKNPTKIESVQPLWSGYGEVFRVRAGNRFFIIKYINPATKLTHPRGWDSEHATARKLKSYEIETKWYLHYSKLCDARVPAFFGSLVDRQYRVLLLEDLKNAGYPLRCKSPSLQNVLLCVEWLASFHAQFLDSNTNGLWPVGTYWHLATRLDEFNAMAEGNLKKFAHKIDRVLTHSNHQTVVHGDAKLANFCFGTEPGVAAVDFQYVGGGCGMKDLAYLISSCFNEDDCDAYETVLLDHYFTAFSDKLRDNCLSAEVEFEWRTLFPVAWTDFYRFLAGWMPTHKKIHRYTKRKAEQTFDLLPTLSEL